MKKKVLLALSLVAAGFVTVGGTLALMSERKVSDNVFTIGDDVAIELTSNNLDKDNDGKIAVMPSARADALSANYTIKNTGDTEAYVWLRIKMPVGLTSGSTAPADNIVHWNTPGAFWYEAGDAGKIEMLSFKESALKSGFTLPTGWEEDPQTYSWLSNEGNNNPYYEIIGDVKYEVIDLLYNKALVKDEETPVGISTIYIDERLDVVDGQYVLVNHSGENKVVNWSLDTPFEIIIEGYAVQSYGFENVTDAYINYMRVHEGKTVTR